MAKKIKKIEVKSLDDLAIEAIDAVFGDTSVSKDATISRLKDLRDELDMKIECLQRT